MDLLDDKAIATLRDPDYRKVIVDVLSVITGQGKTTTEIMLKVYKDYMLGRATPNDLNPYMGNNTFTLPKIAYKRALKVLERLNVIERKYDKWGAYHYVLPDHDPGNKDALSDAAIERVEKAFETLKETISEILINPKIWDEIAVDQKELRNKRQTVSDVRNEAKRKRDRNKKIGRNIDSIIPSTTP